MQYNLKQQQSKPACGRSMIEMLCVLAIIGILSAAAFVGFKAAINKHEANAVLNDAAFALTAIHTRSSETGINEYRIDTGSKWEVSAFRSDELDDFAVVADVPKEVCQHVLPYKSKGTFGKFYDANSGTEEEMQELMSCADTQTIVFAYSQNSDNNPTPPAPEPDCSGITPIESCAISADVKDANGCVIKKKFSCTEGSTYCLDGEQCIACPTKDDIPSRACSIAAFSTCHQVNRDLGEACTNGLCDGEGNCIPQATCTSSQLSCSAGADSWCCDKVNMANSACGTTKGECCANAMDYLCCTAPKTILMDQEMTPHCCAPSNKLGRRLSSSYFLWDCCDVGGTQVLVNSTGTAAAYNNYCCPAGSVAYDATNEKCISECPANASTTVVSGNQIGYSACYCNEGYTWDEDSGTCKAPGRCGTTGTTCDATCETSCTVAGTEGYTCTGGTCTCTTSGYAFESGLCANGYCVVRNSFVLYCPTSANFTVTYDNIDSVLVKPTDLTLTVSPCKGSSVTNTAGITSSASDNSISLRCQPYKDGHFEMD